MHLCKPTPSDDVTVMQRSNKFSQPINVGRFTTDMLPDVIGGSEYQFICFVSKLCYFLEYLKVTIFSGSNLLAVFKN